MTGSHQWGDTFWHVGIEKCGRGRSFSALQWSGWGGGWLLSNCSGDTPEAEMNNAFLNTSDLGAIQ